MKANMAKAVCDTQVAREMWASVLKLGWKMQAMYTQDSKVVITLDVTPSCDVSDSSSATEAKPT
jgi:hypothetical protein